MRFLKIFDIFNAPCNSISTISLFIWEQEGIPTDFQIVVHDPNSERSEEQT